MIGGVRRRTRYLTPSAPAWQDRHMATLHITPSLAAIGLAIDYHEAQRYGLDESEVDRANEARQQTYEAALGAAARRCGAALRCDGGSPRIDGRDDTAALLAWIELGEEADGALTWDIRDQPEPTEA